MSTAAEAHAVDGPAEGAPDRLALSAFTGAVVIGGSNFVAIRFSNRELDPLWGAGLRFVLAAAVFGVLFAALRLRLPRGRDLALVHHRRVRHHGRSAARTAACTGPCKRSRPASPRSCWRSGRC